MWPFEMGHHLPHDQYNRQADHRHHHHRRQCHSKTSHKNTTQTCSSSQKTGKDPYQDMKISKTHKMKRRTGRDSKMGRTCSHYRMKNSGCTDHQHGGIAKPARSAEASMCLRTAHEPAPVRGLS